jgi:hypothetical protein
MGFADIPSSRLACIGVSTSPGAIALKRMPSFAYSIARLSVIASRPPFVIIGMEALTPAMGGEPWPMSHTLRSLRSSAPAEQVDEIKMSAYHPAYARAIAQLKQSGDLGPRCRCRPSPYLNNIIEQDHRFIKKRIAASLGFRSAEGAWRTIEGDEAMHLIRKGQIRRLATGDVVGQRHFIHTLFGVAA